MLGRYQCPLHTLTKETRLNTNLGALSQLYSVTFIKWKLQQWFPYKTYVEHTYLCQETLTSVHGQLKTERLAWPQIRDSAAPPPDLISTSLLWCPKAVKLITPGQRTHLSPNYLLTDRLGGGSIDGRPRSADNGFVSQAVVDWWMLLQRVKLWQRAAGIICQVDVFLKWLAYRAVLVNTCQSCQIHPGMSG